MKEKIKRTNLERYGSTCALLNKEIKDKARVTNLEKYGSEEPLQSNLVRAKIAQINLERYGVENPMQNKEIQERAKRTNLEKYGSEYIMQNDELKLKNIEAKRQNNTFSTSKPEEKYYRYLCDRYQSENIIRQYRDSRYPFACDFYVLSEDLFIELNLTWTHGGKWFNPEDLECKQKLKFWEERAKTSKYYKSAIETWTIRDPQKKKVAEENNLNYKVYWTESELEYK